MPKPGRKLPGIIIVEDDMPTSDVLAYVLRQRGIAAATFATGEEALESMKAAKPVLAVLDLKLRGRMDGYELIDRMRADPKLKDTPIVILTNLGMLHELTRGLAYGVEDYLVKANLSIKEIVDKIEKAVRKITATPR